MKIQKIVKNSKTGIVLLFLFFLVLDAGAQSRHERKWQQTIEVMRQSDFYSMYMDTKAGIENKVDHFHKYAKSGTVSSTDTEIIRKGYDDTVLAFDRILDEFKKNITDPELRKLIARKPDSFAKFLDSDIKQAQAQFMNHVARPIDRLDPNSKPAAFGIMEAQLLITLGVELWKLIEKRNAKLKLASEVYFENHLIQEMRLKRWEEF